MATLAELQQVMIGQSQRTILQKSKSGYLSKMRRMTSILDNIEELTRISLVTNPATSEAMKHTGQASKIYKLILPMTQK
jgi:hypothetical protein